MKLFDVFFLVITFCYVGTTQSLVCRRLCAFIGFSFNQTINVSSCSSNSLNGTSCSVWVSIDHQKDTISGQLGVTSSSSESAFRMDTRMTRKGGFITTIQYRCDYDNCDVDFIQNIMSWGWDRDRITSISHELYGAIHTQESVSSQIIFLETFNCQNTTLCKSCSCENDEIKDIPIYCKNTQLCADALTDQYLVALSQICKNATVTIKVNLRYDWNAWNCSDALCTIMQNMTDYFTQLADCSLLNQTLSYTELSHAVLSTYTSPIWLIFLVTCILFYRTSIGAEFH
jgi:hypothetical protein